MIAELIEALFETTLASSAAIVLVLCLRGLLIRRLGASIAYAAWALVPVAWLAVLLPAPKPQIAQMAQRVDVGTLQPLLAVDIPAPFPWQAWFAALWLLGAIACAVQFWRQQQRFHRQLQASEPSVAGLPAVVGVLRPRVVLPADFETRYSASERELILCHERIHIARGDLQANAIAAALRALYWFNPLLHYAAARFRRDQELACDERVLARHPGQRRSYADAMLKTCMAGSPLPVACQWQASNPLKERIAMLKEHAPRPMRTLVGALFVLSLSVAGGYAAWAAQPENSDTAADAGSAAKERYSMKLKFEMDGKPAGDFKVIAIADQPFGFKLNSGEGESRSYEGTFTASRFKDDLIMLKGTLAEAGKEPSDIGIAVKPGESGSVVIGDRGMPNFKLEVLVNAPTAAELDEVQKAESKNNKQLGCFLIADKEIPNGGSYTCGKPPERRDFRAEIPVASTSATLQKAAASVDLPSKNLNPPRYPAEAARNGVSGKVMLIVDVAANGSVEAVQIEKSQPAGVFDAAVLEAASEWKFVPAIENGKPVAGRVRVPVDFSVDAPVQEATVDGKAQGSAG